MKRGVKKRGIPSLKTKPKPLFRPEELEAVVERGMQLSNVLDGNNNERTSAELFIEEVMESWSNRSQRSENLEDLARRLSDTRTLMI